MAPKEIKRQECQVMMRCCGWLVPKTAGNPGKQAEYEDRLGYGNISEGNSNKL